MLPRAAGVLLHPTSLPGPYGVGDLGPAAVVFLDWAASAGFRGVEFLFPYDAMRAAPDPRRAILEFLESTYGACAQQMGWSSDLTRFEAPS